MSTILCIDDEPAVGVVLEHAIQDLGHRTLLASSVDEGLKALGREAVDLVISDFRMPSATGLDLLEQMRQLDCNVPVIMMTGYSSVENAVLSMKHGAIDYLTKPLRIEALRIAVNNAIEMDRLRRQNEDYRREVQSLRGVRAIVGGSSALEAVMDTIAAVAPTRAIVLLHGESGTGKELFARALHEQGPRRDHPFVTVNCAALPEGLVESTLFGHERGAFTGATARAQGAFERAHRGTLLLDEVSEMRLDLQAKLLRAIQEQEFERVGGNQPVKVDVRIVATTNRDLLEEVEAGRFRRDLYYRLHVVPIQTPSLRERLEDLPSLVAHFVENASLQFGIRAPQVAPETLERLRLHRWPGNVRELANAVERAVILCRDGWLRPESFGHVIDGKVSGRRAAPSSVSVPGLGHPLARVEDHGRAADQARAVDHAGAADHARAADRAAAPLDLRELERDAIERALTATNGHRTRAARLLGISERTLRNKLNVPAS